MRCRLRAWALPVLLMSVPPAWAEAASPVSDPKPPAPASQTTFSERMTVREVEILVERPPERRMPKASSLKVRINGRPRTVVRIESADDDSPWNLVLYIDRELARPGTLFSSLLALADQAEALTGLGRVEVLDAGTGLPLLEPTRDARALRWTLGDLAARLRVDRDRSEAGELSDASFLPLTLETASRRLDRLVVRLAERRLPGPHALFLIADGADPKLAPPFERAARLLAGYGWVTFPVLVRKERAQTEAFAGQTELEIVRRSSDVGAKNNMSIPGLLPTHPAAPSTLTIEGVIELFFDPEVAGFRALARETAGAVIGRQAQLAPALDRLGRRMRVWFDESDPDVKREKEEAEESGKLRRLEVIRSKNELPLRAATYFRASTPEELTAARLRLVLEGEGLKGDFELEAKWGEGGALAVAFERLQTANETDDQAGPVRITWSWIGKDGELETRSQLFPRHELEGGKAEARFAKSIALTLPPGIERIGIVADELASERWGGRVVGTAP